MSKDPDLRTIEVLPGNTVGLTAGVYVRLIDLHTWLRKRDLEKTAAALSKQVLQGEAKEVKAVSFGKKTKLSTTKPPKKSDRHVA